MTHRHTSAVARPTAWAFLIQSEVVRLLADCAGG